jgi:hypothetical protein
MREKHTQRKELALTLRELSAPNSSVEGTSLTDFRVMPGLRFQIDELTFETMTRNKAKLIAKAIELTLIQNTKFNGGEKDD